MSLAAIINDLLLVVVMGTAIGDKAKFCYG